MMELIRFFNDRVKRLTVFDIKLSQGCAMLIALIFAKLVPDILQINVAWFVVLIVLLGIRPVYVFYFRKSPTGN